MDAFELLQKDYELKVNYLTAHFNRMWTRFNFFLTIESALLAFSLDSNRADFTGFIVVTGLSFSVLWYWFAASDNFLVEIYRGQVAHVFKQMRNFREEVPKKSMLKGLSYVGKTTNDGFSADYKVKPIKSNFFQWRFQKVSVTEMGVVFAVLFSFLWIGRFILMTCKC